MWIADTPYKTGHSEETLEKVYRTIYPKYLTMKTAVKLVNELHDQGILFRESLPEHISEELEKENRDAESSKVWDFIQGALQKRRKKD